VLPKISALIVTAMNVAASAVVWMLGIALAGMALIVFGVYLLAGAPWALIAAGIGALCIAFFIRQGLTDG
jgi:hypothetical protein